VFIEGAINDIQELGAAVAARLPNYMVPKKFHVVSRLPRNANDKFDRTAMLRMLGEGS
jgi:acyl-coenzyme A synthetase/AMP-(fatty) acid ligase